MFIPAALSRYRKVSPVHAPQLPTVIVSPGHALMGPHGTATPLEEVYGVQTLAVGATVGTTV